MKMNRARLVHLVTTAFVGSVALLILFIVIPMQIAPPRTIIGIRSTSVTPQLAPQIWTIALVVISFLHLLLAIFFPKTKEANAYIEGWPREQRARASIALLIVGSYIFFAIPLIGFFVSTAIYLFAGYWILSDRASYIMLLTAVGTSATLYVFFSWLMNINPPRGLLF